MSRRRLPTGVSFSLSRAVGLAMAKSQASRDLDVPLSRQARQRKLVASLGCCVMLPMALVATAVWQVVGG